MVQYEYRGCRSREANRKGPNTMNGSSVVEEQTTTTVMGAHRHALGERPDPQWVRGRCPECGDDLVSNLYYIGGKGYLLVWQCWSALSDSPACRYQKVL